MVELQLNAQEDEDINGGGGFDNDFDNNDDRMVLVRRLVKITW